MGGVNSIHRVELSGHAAVEPGVKKTECQERLSGNLPA